MIPTEHTLDDLVQATGFSKRQIRFYITKKLVPGAGPSRGPYATYGEETLQRLRLIGLLKEKRIEPTGRVMTLDEIGHALDTLSADGIEALLSGRAELAILDTDARVGGPLGSAADYLRDLRPAYRRQEPGQAPQTPSFRHSSVMSCEAAAYPIGDDDDLGNIDDYTAETERWSTLANLAPEGGEHQTRANDDLSDLLGRLQALLAELALDSRFTDQATDHPQWLRVTTPDVEFHVRKPDDHPARSRLAAMARALARLLEREDRS
ncbi:MAG: MerR family transcriptional regulator [Candidatus Krumholzibacteriia bacterium]